MSATTSNKSISSLYSDTAKCEQSRDFDKAQRLIDKSKNVFLFLNIPFSFIICLLLIIIVLSIDKNNTNLRHCLMVCKMQQGLFQECLDEINSSPLLRYYNQSTGIKFNSDF